MAYNRRNPARAVERATRYRTANADKVRAYERRYRADQRQMVLDHFGNACACCGESTPEFLTVDHINNDGAEHRRSGVTTIYRWLVKNEFPPGFQLLCWNCNAAKQYRDGCPHQRTPEPGREEAPVGPQQVSATRWMVPAAAGAFRLYQEG